MPIVKATIDGREYAFAPLKIKESRKLATDAKTLPSPAPLYQLLDAWAPHIKTSLERAGSAAPDFEELDSDIADHVLAQFMDGVLQASGVRKTKPGEDQPMTPSDRGTISSAS